MDFDDLALRLALALAIGFVIGLERGWHERDEEEGHRTAGIRTFSLVGLLGGVLGALSLGGDRILLATGLALTGSALAAFMWREGEHQHDFSATSLVAALLAFVLGAFAVLGDASAAAGAGVATVILLANKEILHGWLERISWLELRSGLLLAAMTFIALPLLPDRTVDPWQSINPHELWLMTILIAAISFAGYAAVKLAGPKRGLTLAATLGGLFASTAVTISLARLARTNESHVTVLAGGVLAAGAVMLLRVIVIAGLFSLDLARTLAPVLLAAALVLAVVAVLLVRLGEASAAGTSADLVLRNPFDLAEVLKFGALLGAVTIAAVLVRRFVGDPGLLGLAALSGVADVDAMTLSVARMEPVSPVAGTAVLLTVAVNSLAKSGYAWVAGGRNMGLMVLAGTLIAAGAGLVVLVRY